MDTVTALYSTSVPHKLQQPEANAKPDKSWYFKAVYRDLAVLSQLQVSQGVELPKLKEHVATNTFIMEMFSSLPKNISDKLVDKIVESRKDVYSIKGIQYLHDVTSLLRSYYMGWDIKSNGPSGPAVPNK